MDAGRGSVPLVGVGRRWAASVRSCSRPGGVPGGVGGGQADRARVRRSALGGRGAARVPRASGRVVGRRAAAGSVHGPAGVVRASPGLGGGQRNSTTINLPPLSDQETAELVSHLITTSVLSAELEQRVLERAGGNPLYAEEFVRLLADRGLGRRRDGVAGESAGAHRRAPGHARAGAQGPAAGRGCAWQGVLGRGAGRDGRPRPAARSSWPCTSWPARSSSARRG